MLSFQIQMGMYPQPLWLGNFPLQRSVFIGLDLLTEHSGAWCPPSHRAKTPSAIALSSQPWIIPWTLMTVLLLSFGIWPTSFPEVLKALYRHCLIIPHNTSPERGPRTELWFSVHWEEMLRPTAMKGLPQGHLEKPGWGQDENQELIMAV